MAEQIEKKAGLKEQLGGLAKRFDIQIHVTPGPGAYIKARHKQEKKASAVFTSKTKREYEQRKSLSPDMGKYNVTNVGSLGSDSRVEKGGGGSPFRFLRLSPAKKPIFQSVSPRFVAKSISYLIISQ